MKSPRTFIAAALFAGIINVGLTAYGQSTNTIVVYALPVKVPSHGPVSGCPGAYVGYASYTLPNPIWGWTPATNTTIHTAADGGGRTDTKVQYYGEYGDYNCDDTSISLPTSSPLSPAYEFSIYFMSNVPTTNYPIVLTGFIVSTN